MSYTIRIGEATLDYCPEDGTVGAGVEEAHGGPRFPGDAMTGDGNARHPGYVQWGDFCRRVGLHSFFFDPDRGLMREHPGVFVVGTGDLGLVQAALKALQEKSSSPPGWCECPDCFPFVRGERMAHVDLDGDLARLLWLDYWMTWALKECARPAIQNT